MKTLGCSFEAPFFGATYPDGTCIDGYMWDLDSCDEPGGPLYGGGDAPCPHCNTREYVTSYLDMHFTGNAKQRRSALRKQMRLTKRLAGKWV